MKTVILTDFKEETSYTSNPKAPPTPSRPSASRAPHTAQTDLPYPPFLEEFLPSRLKSAIAEVHVTEGFSVIEEIRLRRETVSLLRSEKGTHRLPVTLTGREMDDTLTRMAGGSLYAHGETITEGYLTLPSGIRVGICGRAATEKGTVIGVYDPTSLVIRIPGTHRFRAEPVVKLLRGARESGRGILIYAPPGGGKTTLLRTLIREMGGAHEPFRVAVVDSRGELVPGDREKRCGVTVDLLAGYPRKLGMEIAVRTLSADIVVCDEIGGLDEAETILPLQNCGVPLLATAHGKDLRDLLRRPGIRLLHDGGVFGHYVGITRAKYGFSYEITAREDADALL